MTCTSTLTMRRRALHRRRSDPTPEWTRPEYGRRVSASTCRGRTMKKCRRPSVATWLTSSPFGDGDHRGVDRPQWKIRALPHQLGHRARRRPARPRVEISSRNSGIAIFPRSAGTRPAVRPPRCCHRRWRIPGRYVSAAPAAGSSCAGPPSAATFPARRRSARVRPSASLIYPCRHYLQCTMNDAVKIGNTLVMNLRRGH